MQTRRREVRSLRRIQRSNKKLTATPLFKYRNVDQRSTTSRLPLFIARQDYKKDYMKSFYVWIYVRRRIDRENS